MEYTEVMWLKLNSFNKFSVRLQYQVSSESAS
jgi:hypothetical protein